MTIIPLTFFPSAPHKTPMIHLHPAYSTIVPVVNWQIGGAAMLRRPNVLLCNPGQRYLLRLTREASLVLHSFTTADAAFPGDWANPISRESTGAETVSPSPPRCRVGERAGVRWLPLLTVRQSKPVQMPYTHARNTARWASLVLALKN
jgi:hypothetical protein